MDAAEINYAEGSSEVQCKTKKDRDILVDLDGHKVEGSIIRVSELQKHLDPETVWELMEGWLKEDEEEKSYRAMGDDSRDARDAFHIVREEGEVAVVNNAKGESTTESEGVNQGKGSGAPPSPRGGQPRGRGFQSGAGKGGDGKNNLGRGPKGGGRNGQSFSQGRGAPGGFNQNASRPGWQAQPGIPVAQGNFVPYGYSNGTGLPYTQVPTAWGMPMNVQAPWTTAPPAGMMPGAWQGASSGVNPSPPNAPSAVQAQPPHPSQGRVSFKGFGARTCGFCKEKGLDSNHDWQTCEGRSAADAQKLAQK